MINYQLRIIYYGKIIFMVSIIMQQYIVQAG